MRLDVPSCTRAGVIRLMERPRVLVIDEDEWARDIASASMSLAGVQTIAAPTGELGLAALRGALANHGLRAVAAVIGELYLPAAGERCLLRVIARDPVLGRIPYVVYSAYAMPEDREWARQNGCALFVAKPAGPRVLLDALDRFIQPFRRSSTLPGPARD